MARKKQSDIDKAFERHLGNTQIDAMKKAMKERLEKNQHEALLASGRMTFGDLIDPAIVKRSYGFVYLITVTTKMHGTRYYAGSRHYEEAGAWKCYISSSTTIWPLIASSRTHPDQVQVEYSIIKADCYNKDDLLRQENLAIRGLVAKYGLDKTLNIRDPYGVSLRTGKMIGQKGKSRKPAPKHYSNIHPPQAG